MRLGTADHSVKSDQDVREKPKEFLDDATLQALETEPAGEQVKMVKMKYYLSLPTMRYY